MKIPFSHFAKSIDSNLNINELSDKLFHLGHEHELYDDTFDIEITPNRGDCLSLNGLLRDLSIFYKTSNEKDIYEKDIEPLSFKFLNNAKDSCSKISFLKVEIDEVPKNYKHSLNDYFSDLNLQKINFFTDVSNFISYETGQPTHCYDSSTINGPISLNFLKNNCEFETLLNKKLNLQNGDLVFFDKNNEVINLAGIVGGKTTACNEDTKSVIIECAHFDPEIIIGKSVKYDINSDAAHKFERGTDPNCHNFVLRRFLNVIENHCNIKDVKLYTETYKKDEKKLITFDILKINKILGTQINENDCIEYLQKFGFFINENIIQVPSHRNDIDSINDICEEVGRAIGYDNIKTQTIDISLHNNFNLNFEENKIKKLLINKGFYEVINNPFVSYNSEESVTVDNPLDSNRKYLRTNLKDSLVSNLLFNERRQKDSIKLFEITDLYSNKEGAGKRAIGIIASGRIGRNYIDFSKKINLEYFKKILNKLNSNKYEIEEISRKSLDSKLKNSIFYCEIEINSSFDVDYSFDNLSIEDISNKKYIPISEFPSSTRDLSFSVKDFSKSKILEEYILNFENKLLKESFVFDYYKNEKMEEIKIGFRFIFQSKNSTITDEEVDNVMNIIISGALNHNSISIPGLS